MFNSLYLQFILDLLGYGELIPSFLVQLMSQIAPKVCTPVPLAASVCESPIYLFAGFDSAQANYVGLINTNVNLISFAL